MNAKRIYRLYTEEGLIVRTKQRKKLASRNRVAVPSATAPNQRWSMDFVNARLTDSRWFRVLTVVDQFTRECLLLYADFSMTGVKVAAALDPIVRKRGKPQSITCDNGLNASEKFGMSAEEVCSTQGMRAVGEISFQESRVPEMVFHEVRDPAHHNEHKICAGAQS